MVKVFKDGSGGRTEIIGKGKNYNPILTFIENGKGERKTRLIKLKRDSLGNLHKVKMKQRSTRKH